MTLRRPKGYATALLKRPTALGVPVPRQQPPVRAVYCTAEIEAHSRTILNVCEATFLLKEFRAAFVGSTSVAQSKPLR